MRAGEILELNSFLAVVEEGRFAAAAVRLGVTPSAVSQSIRRLEARLGVSLLSRTTRSVALTDAGAALMLEVKPALDRLAGAEQSLTGYHAPSGKARISVPTVAMELLIAPILSDFQEKYPDFHLDIVVEDRLTDLVARRYDAVIRRGELLEQDLIAQRLSANDHLVLVASRAFLAGRDALIHPRDLSQDRIVIRRPRSGATTPWSLARDGGIARITGNARLITESAVTARQCAVDGLGIALLAQAYVAEALQSGSLCRVLPEWRWPVAGFHLMYVNRGGLPPTLQALKQAIDRRDG